MLDEIDLQLLHALHIDGRAPFSKIAEVLGVSDRTIARRYGRLRATGGVRVTGITNSFRTGTAEWVVRMRVDPQGTAGLARALARRPDTAWVTAVSSGSEIVCIFRVPDDGPAPLAELSRHPQITEVTAYRLLRYLMNRRWRARTSALTAAQIEALRPPRFEELAPSALTDLTELDRRLLPALAVDGRAAFPDLARRLGWSESAIRRRLDELRRAHILHFDVETNPALFGFTSQCVLWLTVAPSHLTTVSESLAADPDIAFVGAITGTHNLLAIAVLPDTSGLYTYLTERLAGLPGINLLESAPVTSYSKRAAPTT